MISSASSPSMLLKAPRKDREDLLFEQALHFTAFSPRPGDRAASRNATPTTLAKINTNHKLRTAPEESTIIFPLKNYQLWKDVGNMEPVIPKDRIPNANSNVWRSFSSDQNVNFSANNRSTPELIAAMYPIQIPTPSSMGEYTFTQYIKYGDIFVDRHKKAKKLEITDKEIREMKTLKTLTEARVPPTYTNGKIAPPLALRKMKKLRRSHDYTSYDDRMEDVSLKMDTGRGVSDSVSMGTRSTTFNRRGLLWKFSYKLNNPTYDKVIKEQNEVRRWKEENARKRRLQKQTMQQRMIQHYQVV